MMAAPRAPDTPVLLSVGASGAGGDICSTGEWVVTVSWDTQNPNDDQYHIEIDKAEDAAGTSFSAWVGPLTTADSSTDEHTEIQGNISSLLGVVTFYRKYRVRLVRTGVGDVQTMETGQVSLTYGVEPCL